MNVLLITNLYPSLREPTRGVFNQQWYGALSRYCKVRVVAPIPWWSRIRKPKALFDAPREERFGLSAVYPTYWSIPGFPALHAGGMRISLRPTIRELRREFAFDVVIASWAYPDAVAAAAVAREARCPLLVQVLGSDINELALHPRLRRQIAPALTQAARVVAVSGALGERVVSMGVPKERVIVQYNAVNGEQFALRDRNAARSNLGLPTSDKIICYVGNFRAEKGTDVLIEAFGRLSGIDNVLLTLVGGGDLEPRMRQHVSELHLDNRVLFAGRKHHAEIADWITACDVFCLPSLREGCPNVVLEALASGRPVVASRVGGVPELIDNVSGVLTEPGDAESLSAGLMTALERSWDPQALRDSVRYLDWDTVGRNLYGLLTEVVPTRSMPDTVATR